MQKALAFELKKNLFDQQELQVEEYLGAFQRAVENSFKKVCEINHKLTPHPLGTINRVGVFAINSQDKPGYIVMAMQKEYSQLDDLHLQRCQGELTASLSKLQRPIQRGIFILGRNSSSGF